MKLSKLTKNRIVRKLLLKEVASNSVHKKKPPLFKVKTMYFNSACILLFFVAENTIITFLDFYSFRFLKNSFIAAIKAGRLSLEVECPAPSITTILDPGTKPLNFLTVSGLASSN